MDSKKILMEETSGGQFRRFLLEQGACEEPDKEEDYVKNLKQGAAKNTILFINGAINMVVPALITGLVIFLVVMYLIFRG